MRVAVRGVELAVEDRGSGAAVVWGHGLTSSMAGDDQLGILHPHLPEDRYRLVRYDARGHGGSTGSTEPADYVYAALAEDQLALADALGLDRFVASGASLGTGTALHVAVRAPERVRALVLVIPPTAWEGRRDQGGRYHESARLVAEEGIDALIAQAEAEPLPAVFEPYADLLRAGVRARYEPFDPEVLAALLTGVGGSDLPGRDEVAAIRVPTLVLAWEGDPIHPRSTADELGALIPGAEVHVAADLAEATTWRGRILDFLDGV